MNLIYSRNSVSELNGATWIIQKYGLAKSKPEYLNTEEMGDVLLQLNIKWHDIDDKKSLSRLFSCSGASGSVKIEDIRVFTQEDLLNNMVMILDAIDTIYIWFGVMSKANEKIIAIKTMNEFKKVTNRIDIPIYITFPFQEPINFTRHFHGWSKDKFKPEQRNFDPVILDAYKHLASMERTEYSKEFLLSGNVPDYLDKTSLELYLNEIEFEEVFGLPKKEYLSLTSWKQDSIKRKTKFY